MAKAIQTRDVRLQQAPATVVDVQPFWQQPKGLNFSTVSSQLGPAFQTEATNVRLNRGYICSRPGLAAYGTSTHVGGNIVPWSNDLTQAFPWFAFGTGSRVQNAVGIDGTPNTATTLTDSNVFGFYHLVYNLNIPSGEPHVYYQYVHIKQDTDQTRFPRIEFALGAGSSGSFRRIDVDLNTQTGDFIVSSGSGLSTARVINASPWWIVEIALTNDGNNPLILCDIVPAWGTTIGVQDQSAVGSIIVGNVQVAVNQPWNGTPVLTTATPISGITGSQLQAINFIKSTGESYVLRFDTDRLYLYNGVTWIPFTGAGPFTGSVNDFWTYTAWNDTLIVSNGVDGTYTLDPIAITATAIASAPPAKQITTWAGRIIASNTKEIGLLTGNRIRWSTKNSSTDWSGIGSGFEDLLSTPGGETDSLVGVFPVAEETAFIVRSNSIWQMAQTGDPDAPFRFSRTYNQVGSIAPHSVQSTPDGIVFFSIDNIYYITLAGIQTIGGQIWTKFRNIVDMSKCWGLYNSFNREYHLGVGESTTYGSPALDVDWVYSFLDQGWTRYKFPFNFYSLGSTRYSASGPIDDLTGTIDSLLGTIDILGIRPNGEGMFVVASTAGKYVTLLDPVRFQDVTFDSIVIDSSISIASGTITEGDTRFRTKLVQVELEYEAAAPQTLTFKTSSDGGVTWTQFGGPKAITPTTRPTLLRTSGVVSRNANQIQVSSTSLGRITIDTLYVHVVKDSRINP